MRIAVIGSGISGLGSAWLLKDRHDVVLYEKEHRLGGHSHTVDTEWEIGGSRRVVPVDTGFIVYNTKGYIHLPRLFDRLGVETVASTMSLSISLDCGRMEYGGTEWTILAQPSNLLRPRFLVMIADILKFFRSAERVLDEEPAAAGGRGPTLREWVAREGYSRGFIEDHLLPMAAAIWSCPVATMMDFPARSFIRFFKNHALLQLWGRPRWRTVVGGSRQYVQKIAAALGQERIRLGQAVVAVEPLPGGGVRVRDGSGHEDHFDQVVMASHGPQSLAMLGESAARQKVVLAAFSTQENRVILHRDAALMPKRRRVWGAWNYMAEGADPAQRQVAVTYWMNALQHIDEATPLFVTLNPHREPAPETVFGRWSYAHPVFDEAAIRGQGALARIQGEDGLWFAGAWTGYGFHDDGLGSAVRVARSLGCPPPWETGGPVDTEVHAPLAVAAE